MVLTADPLWPDGPPPNVNLGEAWLAKIKALVRVHPEHEAPGFLQSFVCDGLSIDCIQPGRLLCTLLVSPGVLNRYGTLHGGTIGTLIEIMGTAVIKSVVGPLEGVVTDINISYISSSDVQEQVEFEAQVLRHGRRICVASVDVRNKASQKPAAQGRVTMCFGQTSKL